MEEQQSDSQPHRMYFYIGFMWKEKCEIFKDNIENRYKKEMKDNNPMMPELKIYCTPIDKKEEETVTIPFFVRWLSENL